MTGDRLRDGGRWLLGVALLAAGTGHLTAQREEFRAQVPEWFPVDADLVVVLSGVVEIVLGMALLFLSSRRALVGWVVAAFFVVIFPGNIAQFVEGTDDVRPRQRCQAVRPVVLPAHARRLGVVEHHGVAAPGRAPAPPVLISGQRIVPPEVARSTADEKRDRGSFVIR